MTDLRQAAQQALNCIKRLNKHGWILADHEDEVYSAIIALKAALKQQPVQEPTPWRDMIVVTLVREGINKHRARELADHFAAQPEQEPVGEVVEIGDHGFRCEFSQHLPVGTKLYIAPPPPVQEPLEQLRPAEFIQLTKGKEAVTGIPAYCWSEWLNKEQP